MTRPKGVKQKKKQSMFKLLVCIFILGLLSCKKSPLHKNNAEITQKEIFNQFEDEEFHGNELFRMFVSSEQYIRKQAKVKQIMIEYDPQGDLKFQNEIRHYNKINFKAKARLKIMLHEDTGTLSRIRFVRSSGISELDKIIADDITRWSFSFPNEKIEPTLFEVSYYIFLKNEISREEAKEELKKYAQ